MWLVGVMAVVAVLQLPSVARAADCGAFQDVNDDGIFNGADVLVPDASWLGGTEFVSNHPFVVPATCDKILAVAPGPLTGVKVTATKIQFFGKLEQVPPGGRGIVLIADPTQVPAPGLGNGDLIVGDGTNSALIKSGGANNLPINTIAVAQKSVALIGTGECKFTKAEIRGVAPFQNTKVGILCTNDLTFVGSKVIGSKVNIQSLQGAIIASGAAGPGGFSLADLCDNSATNLAGHGNNNGILDAGDFPCTVNVGPQLSFPNQLALAAACLNANVPPGVGNVFQAFNDPLIMIAGAGANNDLDVQGASIVGRYRVTLAAEDGNILTQGAVIDHGEQLGLTPPGGARTYLFANPEGRPGHPVAVVRLPVDREDFFGPSIGSTNITGTCFKSSNPILVGQDAGGLIHLIGVPAAGCAQNPPDFVPVLDAIF
jgi:hypothetical protein